jgi:hypothetical protein
MNIQRKANDAHYLRQVDKARFRRKACALRAISQNNELEAIASLILDFVRNLSARWAKAGWQRKSCALFARSQKDDLAAKS